MKARLIDYLEDKAEGRCCGFPYDTQLAGPGGVSIHFWVGETYDPALVQKALDVARAHRDVVYATCSLGQPTKFWANSDME